MFQKLAAVACHDRWIEVATRMGEVVRMFNGGKGEWCLASQEEIRIAEVGISHNEKQVI